MNILLKCFATLAEADTCDYRSSTPKTLPPGATVRQLLAQSTRRCATGTRSGWRRPPAACDPSKKSCAAVFFRILSHAMDRRKKEDVIDADA